MSFGYFGTGQLSKYVPSGMCAKEVTSWWGNESIANSPQRHSPLPTAGKPQERSIPDFPLEEFIVVISVVSLLTNLSVLLNFTHSAELRSHVSGIFILNLSFSNILLTIINMPATFLWWLKDGSTSGTLSMAALVFPMSYSSKMRCKDAFVVVEFFWLDLLSFSICFFIGTFILCFSPCYNEVGVALCAHPPVLGHDRNISVQRQYLQRPGCVLRQQYRKVLVSIISCFLRKSNYSL